MDLPPPDPPWQSTPQAQGTAIMSEYVSGTGVLASTVHPWIAQDIDKAAKCSVDDMLKDFLGHCADSDNLPLDSSGKTRLLQDCLASVLLICNDKFQPQGLKANPSKIKDYLAAYAEKSNSNAKEKDLYSDFVKATNTALQCLDLLAVPNIQRRDKSPIYFHVNDPTLLEQNHGEKTSYRKPDVLVVSKSDDSQAHGTEESSHQTIDRELFTKATMPPKVPFNWRDVHTFMEFKKARRNMPPPPASYTVVAETEPSKRRYLTGSAQSGTPSAAPAGPSVNPPPPPPEPLQTSAAFEPAATSSKKRTAEQVDKSNSKRQKMVAKSTSELQTAGSGPSRPPPEPVQTSVALESAATGSSERTVEQADIVESEMTDESGSNPGPPKPQVQAGSYAAEMFTAHAGRQHVIGLVVIGDLLYVWHYDRQSPIECSAFNFIQDLPRLLVLLLVMQRFQDRHWGLNDSIDPNFGTCQDVHEMTLHDEKVGNVDLAFELTSKERVSHFGLNGWASNVFPVTSTKVFRKEDLVAKVSWAQESRTSEPDILKKVYEIAKENGDVKGHVPDMMCYQAFLDTSTAKIRQRLGINTNGSRVLYVIVFRKLKPITALIGDEFLRTWWETVMCHLALWKNGVFHRDASPSNLMCRRVNGKAVGVLNDFDLASIKDGPSPTGTERTGTVPVMALALLDDPGLKGKIKHLYRHDAESFIWVLTWITVQYANGKLRAKEDRPLEGWLGVDVPTCRKERADFLLLKHWELIKGGLGHEHNYEVAKACLRSLLSTVSQDHYAVLPVDAAFKKLLYDPVTPFLAEKKE